MMNFKKDVLEASSTKPVLVDFWAPWCGPCRVLGPTLETLAEEQKDRWTLVKVNTEEEQELALEYGIRSIPNVKLFHHGKLVAEFAGALPKTQIERWLDDHLPDAGDEALQAILQQEQSLPGEAFEEKLRSFLEQNPDNREARLALASHSVFKKPDVAVQLLEDIREDEEEYGMAEDLKALATLMTFEKSNGAIAGKHLLEARQALQLQDLGTAVEKIIEAVVADKNYHHDLPRRSAVALFHLLGNEHEITQKYRRQFNMALY
ncbi:MAG: thioredoxin [Saprospiraceae bacterium]